MLCFEWCFEFFFAFWLNDSEELLAEISESQVALSPQSNEFFDVYFASWWDYSLWSLEHLLVLADSPEAEWWLLIRGRAATT